MLLTISTTHRPATDLGYLLHKHPGKLQSFPVSVGMAHVYYPHASDERCTVALHLQADPLNLMRRFKGGGGPKSSQDYVNDRPYVASSFLSVALNRVFRSAFAGTCRDRQQLADSEIPLRLCIYSLPCRGGEALLRRLFEPLGYEVQARPIALDTEFPEWGDSPCFDVTIRGVVRLRDLLRHAYVLIPVLDREKHYWVGDDEVRKLLQHGDDWLAAHPHKESITSRYLKEQRSLARDALLQLTGDEGVPDAASPAYRQEHALEAPVRLAELRSRAIVEAIEESRPRSVLDLGCGEGNLLRDLLKLRYIDRIVGVDVSPRALEKAQRRLRLGELPERQQQRIELLNGSLLYRDRRLTNFDAAIAAEVIEHIEPDRLPAFERAVFEFARPRFVIVTTPNAQYNRLFESLAAGHFRHADHRFEWTRPEFDAWVRHVCTTYDYRFELRGIGPFHADHGPPTQMALLHCDRAGQ